VRGGATLEQPIDAGDVLDAIRGALRSRDAAGESFDLGGPECLTHRDLVLRAAALFGRRPRIVPVPLALARLGVRVAERLLASPPVTLAMLEVLEHDDRVDPGPACARLGVTLTPLDTTLRRCVGAEAPSP
jgi:NADH dehydrogenase